MKKPLTAMLLLLAATTASAGDAPLMPIQLAAIGVEAEAVPTHRRARANGAISQADATNEAKPRRPRAGGTIILASNDSSQPRRARANWELAVVEVAQTSRRPRANGPIVARTDVTDEAGPRRPRAGGTTVLVAADALQQPRRARANGEPAGAPTEVLAGVALDCVVHAG